MSALLSATAVKALGTPVETSLHALLEEYGLAQDAGLLLGLKTLQECFEHYGLRCSPPIGQGDLTEPRVLSNAAVGSLATVLEEISRLESADVEFKSTLHLDRKHRQKDPGRPLPDYRSEKVLKSALKTVAAFANGGGGTLYFGVEDNGNVCGLEDDFGAVDAQRGDFDGWDLHFRNLIRARLSDGAALSAYVQTHCYQHLGSTFVQAKIASRGRLTFLKANDVWELFIRVGTQTNSIPFCEIEQHYELKRLY